MLSNTIRALRSADQPTERAAEAEALVRQARQLCAQDPQLEALCRAAEALLETLDRAGEPVDPGDPLIGKCHAFIDLARLKSVRRAAYSSLSGGPGERWVNLILSLIEKSHFTTGPMFRQRAAQNPDKTLFVVPQGEHATEYTWRQVLQSTEEIALGMAACLGEGKASDTERWRVALLTPNRIDGALADLACLTNGIFNTVVPANSVESQIEHIVHESGARLLVVSGGQLIQKALTVREDLPRVEWIVTLDDLPRAPGSRVMSLKELITRGAEVDPAVLTNLRSGVRSSDDATTMYTSGTTGLPKGIRFSHLNLVSKRFCRAAALPEIDEDEVLLCYLPLYHTFGRWLEMMACVHLAATYIFAENPSTETLIQHMHRFQPTAMISVPKKWRDLHARVVGTEGDQARPETPDDPEQIRRAVTRLTGGRLRWGLSAAGRLDPDIFRFFQNNGIDLLSGYGMTEATGGITMTPPGCYLEESIGKALPGIEISLGEDGELLLRGPYVTSGYANPEDNANAFQDGWFRTGDLVSCDQQGYLRHVDRKKDIYKNASGRTIAPQRIEALFADFPEVARVFAVGDGREYVTLLIRPNIDYAEVRFDRMNAGARHDYFRELVVSCNRFLAPFERVVSFALLDRDFSLARRELTLKGSFRRAVVEENFREIIEPMYASTAILREVDGIRVKVPIAFLQHLGATETGTRVRTGNLPGLQFRAIGKRLRIRRDPSARDRVWVGNCCYQLDREVIDLDDWVRLPDLWVGNAELTHITGETVLLWSLSAGDRVPEARMTDVQKPSAPVDEWRKRLEAAEGATPSLLTVHAAAVLLSGDDTEAALRAVDYLAYVMHAGLARYTELAESQLQLASRHDDATVRGRAFVTLLEHQQADRFGNTAELFVNSGRDFLDESACQRMALIGNRPAPWSHLSVALAGLRRRMEHATEPGRAASSLPLPEMQPYVVELLQSLGRVAELEWAFYLPIRRELVAWQLAPVAEEIRRAAALTADVMTERFRASLGGGQAEATDPQTGRSYTWRDTLLFEDGVDQDEVGRVTGAIANTSLVREAVCLLCNGRRIDLEDVAPRSMWISLLTSRFGRSIYHAGLRTRAGERCDFTIFVRNVASEEMFQAELRLLCLAAEQPGGTPLSPQLGGCWPGHQIATAEYVSGESVGSLARHMHDHPDRHVRQRVKDAWRHVCWSALTAVFEFFRRTEQRWTLASTVTRDVTVPLNDFEAGTRLLSVGGRRPFRGAMNMILQLQREFHDRVRFQFPALAPETDRELIFAAALESLGQAQGLDLLREAISDVDAADQPSAERLELRQHLETYVASVVQNDYLPRALHCAIARYDSWSSQVPNAAAHTRAAQLRELENNYDIPKVTEKFPGTRLWLYSQTVLKGLPRRERATVEHAIRRLRSGDNVKEAMASLYADLQHKLSSQELAYYLTRATYPHLEPDENAELVTISAIGADRAELITRHTDVTGRELHIRPVANSREVDTLHRFFYAGGIGGVGAQNQLLVAIDDTDTAVGGLGYIRRTPTHAVLDKIAVTRRCRGLGIGRIIVKDFLRRLEAEGVTICTAQLIRRDWLEQFGFKSHPRYPGMALGLPVEE